MGWRLPSLRWLNRPSYSSLRPRVYWIAIVVVLVCCQDIGYCSSQAGVWYFCFLAYYLTKERYSLEIVQKNKERPVEYPPNSLVGNLVRFVLRSSWQNKSLTGLVPQHSNPREPGAVKKKKMHRSIRFPSAYSRKRLSSFLICPSREKQTTYSVFLMSPLVLL
jgi:hypothetical protein